MEKYILMGVFWALTAFSYFACYKFGYYSGRLAELKENRKWLNGLLEEAEKREAIKNAATKPAPVKK